MCSHWTQDERVYAVLHGGSEVLRACLAKAGVPMIYENVFAASDDRQLRQFRTTYEINTISFTRLARVMADQLAAGQFVTPKSVVGVLTWDEREYKESIANVLKPALARHGVGVKQEFYIKYSRTASDQAEALGSLPNAVLQMKNAGVDRIIIFGDTGGAIAAYFSRNAQSQNYHPRYGMESGSAPQVLIDTGNADAAEFVESQLVGWNPYGDVGNRPHVMSPPGYKRCADIMAKGGASFEGNDNARVVALRTCDGFFFLAAGIGKGLPSITVDSFVRGAESLGRFPSALSYATVVTPTGRDGVGAVRRVKFDTSCTCYKYSAPLTYLR